MKKIVFILVLLLSSLELSYSLDTTSTKYYPLKIGNSWTYLYSHYLPPGHWRVKKTVISSFIQYGHVYYKIKTTSEGYVNTDTLIYRVDSLNGRLLKKTDNCNESPVEMLVDSLSAHLLDSAVLRCLSYYNTSICKGDTFIFNNFSLIKTAKIFYHPSLESFEENRYAKDIGLYHYGYVGQWNYELFDLIGCIIDGIKYGDTTLIGINQISTLVPESFMLYQNYPNPFNPSTKIKFDVGPTLNPLLQKEGTARSAGVVLKVYDILGKEIATLVNETLFPGTYEVVWDASNYPSGVYFYTLSTNSFTQTKKMILIK